MQAGDRPLQQIQGLFSTLVFELARERLELLVPIAYMHAYAFTTTRESVYTSQEETQQKDR